MKRMDIEEFSHKFAEMFVEVMKPIMQKPLIETREERIKREYAPIGGPGKPTVNAFVETYDRQAEMRVRAFQEGRTE